MQKLIDGELVSIKDPPRVCQIRANGVAGRTVFIYWLSVVPIIQVEQKAVGEDFNRRYEIAPLPGLISQDGDCFNPSGSGGPIGTA